MSAQQEAELRTNRQLNHTFWKLQRAMRTRLEPFALTPRQYSLLVHVGEEGTAFTDLAEHMYADLSTVNGIVNRLEKQGYLVRERCLSDRRVVLIRLTAEGKELRQRVVPYHHAQIHEIYAGLSEQELQDLRALLARLFRALD